MTRKRSVQGSLSQRPRHTAAPVAAAGVAAVIFVSTAACSSDPEDVTPDPEESPAAAPAVVEKFQLPGDSEAPVGAPVFAVGDAWIPSQGGQLTRVDGETNESEVVRKRNGMGAVSAMSAFASIWLWNEREGLLRLDPDDGAVTAHIPEDVAPVSTGFGSLWGLDVGHEVLRIDPHTNQVVARLRVSDNEEETHASGCVDPFRATCPDYLTVHQDRVVVFIDGEDTIVHIDPATNQVTKRVKMPGNPSGFYRLNGEVPWLMTEGGLAQVDLDSGEVLAQVPLEDHQRTLWFPALHHAIAVNGDTAWLVTDYTTTEIDLKRATVIRTFDTPSSGTETVLAASFGHGDLWVSYTHGTVRRLDLPAS